MVTSRIRRNCIKDVTDLQTILQTHQVVEDVLRLDLLFHSVPIETEVQDLRIWLLDEILNDHSWLLSSLAFLVLAFDLMRELALLV